MFRILLLLLGCFYSIASYAVAPVKFGQVDYVLGLVSVTHLESQNKIEYLKVGSTIYKGDKIKTSISSEVMIVTEDDSSIAIKEKSELKIDEYYFDENLVEQDNFVVSLIKGGFRSVTGLIGTRNKEKYKIVAPTATIGIRGTDHEPTYIPENDLDYIGQEPGLYDKVNEGESFIQTGKEIKSITPGNQLRFYKNKMFQERGGFKIFKNHVLRNNKVFEDRKKVIKSRMLDRQKRVKMTPDARRQMLNKTFKNKNSSEITGKRIDNLGGGYRNNKESPPQLSRQQNQSRKAVDDRQKQRPIRNLGSRGSSQNSDRQMPNHERESLNR